jgi:hypothetical protein
VPFSNTTKIFNRHELTKADAQQMLSFYSQDRVRISDSIVACLPPVNLPNEAQPRQCEGYLLDGVIRLNETHLEDPYFPGPHFQGTGGFGASLYI